MSNRLGPEVRGVTVRPGAPTPSGADTWFQDCVGGDPATGTPVEQGWFNRIIANFRSLFTQVGQVATAGTGDDNMLRDGVALQTQYGQMLNGGITTGTGALLSATLSPTPLLALVQGQKFVIELHTNILDNPTLKFTAGPASFTSPHNLTYTDGSPVLKNDYLLGANILVCFDGANYQVLTTSRQYVTRISRSLNRTILTAVGAFDFVVPANVTVVRARGWGAGGGGGMGVAGSGSPPSLIPSGAGVGGGGGAYFERTMLVTPGDHITGGIGVGGPVGTAGSDAGFGGDTTVVYGGLTATAGGGRGGRTSAAGTAQNAVAGGFYSGTVDFGRNGEEGSGGHLNGSASDVASTIGGDGGSSPGGGYRGVAGTGSASNGNAPGGGGGGSGAGQPPGIGARGEVWFEY